MQANIYVSTKSAILAGMEIYEDYLTKNVSLENLPRAPPHGETLIEWDDHG